MMKGHLILRNHPLYIVTLVKDDQDAFFETRNSIIAQSFTLLHLVVDSSLQELHVPESPPYIETIKIVTPPQGIYPAMNLALDWIENNVESNAFVLFLNSGDTFISDSTLSTLTQHLKPSIQWIYTKYLVVDPKSALSKEVNPFPFSIENQLYARNPINHQAYFVNNSILNSELRFNVNLKVAADWDFIIRVAKIHPGHFINQTTTAFKLGGFADIYRQQGNKELKYLRTKYLENNWPGHLKNIHAYYMRTFRNLIYLKFIEKSKMLNYVVRRIFGWSQASKID